MGEPDWPLQHLGKIARNHEEASRTYNGAGIRQLRNSNGTKHWCRAREPVYSVSIDTVDWCGAVGHAQPVVRLKSVENQRYEVDQHRRKRLDHFE